MSNLTSLSQREKDNYFVLKRICHIQRTFFLLQSVRKIIYCVFGFIKTFLQNIFHSVSIFLSTKEDSTSLEWPRIVCYKKDTNEDKDGMCLSLFIIGFIILVSMIFFGTLEDCILEAIQENFFFLE